MDFELSETQKDLVKAVRKFAQKEIKPLASKWDEEEAYPWPNHHKLGELGYLGISVPEEYGGGGGCIMDAMLVIEELAKVDVNTATIAMIHNGVYHRALLELGNEEQMERWVPGIASGKIIPAWGMSEPDAGSDVGNIRTRAVLDGDHYVLNGSKCFISAALVADLVYVFARFNDDPGTKGLGIIMVEKGTPGFSVGAKLKKMGFRGTGTSELYFDKCRVPKENLLIGPGNFKKIMESFNRQRCLNCALNLGCMSGALEESIKYAGEREQFGKTIDSFQAIQMKLADMHIMVEAGRWLSYLAADSLDKGKARSLVCSVAKTYTGEVAPKVCDMAMQIFGGYGYSREYPLERAYRDIKVMSFGAGTLDMQKLLIASFVIGKRIKQ